MSYSFTIKQPTKNEAKIAVRAEFDKIVTTQPSHAKECDAVIAAADGFIEALDLKDGQSVEVSIYGSVSWTGVWGSRDTPAAVSSVQANIAARAFQRE